MDNIEKYKSLVETCSPTINPEMNIVKLYDHYGISHEDDVYSTRIILDHLIEIIYSNLRCRKNCVPNHLKKIRDHLLLEFFFEDNEPLNPIFVLDAIIDAIREIGNNIVSFDETDLWLNAIVAALDYNVISNIFVKLSSQLKKDEVRLFNLAKSAKYFKNKGYDINIDEGKVLIANSGLESIVKEIDDHMRLLGGIKFTSVILNRFSSLFDHNLKRFQLNRTLGFGENPLVPVGYLLNLAAKHSNFTEMIDESMWEYYYDYLITLSRHLGVVYNVQPYNNFQLMFKGTSDPIGFIREIALFDSMFTLTQLRPSDVTRILNGLFGEIDQSEMKDELGFNLKELNDVINMIFDLAANNFLPLVFKKEHIKYRDETVRDNILNVLSLDLNEVNNDYILPTDMPNFIFNPLIKFDDQFVLLNKSWCSPAFYEALENLRRDKWENLNLGIEIENFIKTEMGNKNITFTSGHYIIDGVEGDCDIIVESENTIVMIEVKKKALTRASQSGDDVAIILDLSKSLLDSQLQIGKHETILRTNGYIEFDNGDKLEFLDRTIERISLTLLDYGGFHDRHVINQLLEVMSLVDFKVHDLEYERDFEKLKDKTDKLKKQSLDLVNYDDAYKKYPFFNCWFLSLPQLLILIDDSTGNESFIEQLRKIKHIMFMSLDFYFEYGELNRILA